MGDRIPRASRNPEGGKNKAKEGEGAGSRMLFMLLYKPNTDLHEAGHLAQASELFHPTPRQAPFPQLNGEASRNPGHRQEGFSKPGMLGSGALVPADPLLPFAWILGGRGCSILHNNSGHTTLLTIPDGKVLG